MTLTAWRFELSLTFGYLTCIILTADIRANSDRIKRERTPALSSTVLSLTLLVRKGQTNTDMIRLFSALCKSLFKKISDDQIFINATLEFSHHGERCPCCGAAGKLSPYNDYARDIVFRRDRKNKYFRIKPLRFKCGSCGATHALLPDILIPYSPYSLCFKLSVLIAYFERDTSVVEVCESFGIAVSTLYEWKACMAIHKDLMLGVLLSLQTPALEFLKGLINSDNLSEALRCFFQKHGFSFMQMKCTEATRYAPP